MEEEHFNDYECYVIVEQGGKTYMHMFCSVWKNDGREGDNGEELPYTVTEYTNCFIPVGELVACKTPDDRWKLICSYQADVQQYEGDYTWDGLIEAGYGDPRGSNGVITTGDVAEFSQELPYADVWFDTPCGDYHYFC